MTDNEFTCVCCGDIVDETDEICQECRIIRIEEQEIEDVAELGFNED